MLARKALAGTAAAPKVYVEDVFSTYLFTQTSTGAISNGIDLAGKGGMVWQKARTLSDTHKLMDTVRGTSSALASDTTQAAFAGTNYITSFNSDGFTTGPYFLTYPVVSWTFRKAEKFFDVVTYTGNGTAGRTVSHNLGSTPGCIIVKSTSSTGWYVYHRSLGATKILTLDTTDPESTNSNYWNNTEPTSTVFTLGAASPVNGNGNTYVAYLFAHDAGGFGDAGSDSIIKCGSFTTNGSGTATVTLGYEPQWVMIKRTDSSTLGGWFILDNMRGFAVTSQNMLEAQSSAAEVNYPAQDTFPTSTGFQVTGNYITLPNASYIYIAIRRGPMKTPETGTSVFNPVVYTGTNANNRLIDTTIAPDMAMIRRRDSSTVDGMYVGTRLLGDQYLLTGTDAAGATDADSFMTPTSGYGNAFSAMNGVGVGVDATRQFNANTTSNNHVIHAFKRAPKFFDVVCYTGTGANRTVTHNLGVAPELMIVKRRGAADNWSVYANNDNTDYLVLNLTDATVDDITFWNDTSPTSSVFTVGTNIAVNGSGSTYVAYLFASLTGISKVGSYTGNGSTTGPTVTTGFSPRYLLIKSISTSGEWVVYDTARGLGSGNEPTILLATASAEYSGNYISPSSTGFQLVSNAGDINTNNQTYLYLAIA